MKQLLFISLLFFATPVYAGTPMDSTAVNVGIGKIFDSSGRIKRLISVPGQEATIRNDIGAASSGNNSDITGLGPIAFTGTISVSKDISAGSAAKLIDLSGSTLGTDDYYVYMDGNTYWAKNLLKIATAGSSIQAFDGYFNTLTSLEGTANIQINPQGTGDLVINTDSDSDFNIGSGKFLVVGNNGNVGFRTSSFGTATGVLAIANGTITGVAAIAGQGMIACENGELKAMDASGNITPFSPHSELDNLVTNLADPLPHTYVSTNSYLGKKKIVNMAALIEEIERLSGKVLVTYEDVSKRDWTADQDDFRVGRDLERLDIEAKIDELNLKIVAIDNELIISVVSDNKRKELENKKIDYQNQKAGFNDTIPPEYIPQSPPKWMQDRGVKLDL